MKNPNNESDGASATYNILPNSRGGKKKIKEGRGDNNPWRTATILLVIVLIGLFVPIILNSKEEVYEFEHLNISKSNFEALSNVMKEYDQFPICNIEQNVCVMISRIGR
ncbi:hypothetical protein LCGC14_1861540 [marine sediment metagenome]|uniref:Uncharacterized protein n=1 Tax=marine sediment metagenome TaxID=412755 RepID=A0A0F9G7G6_9ZZZZ